MVLRVKKDMPRAKSRFFKVRSEVLRVQGGSKAPRVLSRIHHIRD